MILMFDASRKTRWLLFPWVFLSLSGYIFRLRSFLSPTSYATGSSVLQWYPRMLSPSGNYSDCIRRWASQVDARNATVIRVRYAGQTGSQFFCLAHAYIIAKVWDIKRVAVPMGFFFLSHTIVTLSGIRISPNGDRLKCRAPVCVTGVFGGAPHCPVDDQLLVIGDLIQPFRQMIPRPSNVSEDLLVIHLRGNDGFWGRWSRMQPPCSFFLHAMANYRRSLLLTDGRNPCQASLVRAGATIFPMGVRESFAQMVFSRNLVLSRSCFSHAALWMSREKKYFWSFATIPGGFSASFGWWTNCVIRDSRLMAKLQNWSASPEQIRIVMSADCLCRPERLVPGL
jgi:hypothetical protein